VSQHGPQTLQRKLTEIFGGSAFCTVNYSQLVHKADAAMPEKIPSPTFCGKTTEEIANDAPGQPMCLAMQGLIKVTYLSAI